MAKPRKRQSQSNPTPIYRADGRAVVGRVEGDTFHKSARSSVHMLRRPRAWAADVDALDLDTGAIYRAALVDFYRRGVAVNRGHGPQLALPLDCWDVAGGRRSTARPGQLQDAAAGGPVQLRLIA